ncbi:type IV toxin-antitoxin system AbiEi family antitoxin [Rathayibacter agropyri]
MSGPPPFARLNGWRSDRDPNILVRQVFWSDPGQQPGRQAIQKAPPLLVYADLLAAGEGRQRDAARSMREVNPDLRAS